METLVIDIGNTLLSWRYRDGSGDLRFGTASHQAISDALCDLPVADAIAISSVQAAHEGELKTWLERCGYSDPVWVRSGADVSSTVLTDEPEKTGADRALNALAWGALSEGRSAVIIDAGSAVTVDAVTAAGQLQGGWIAPGFHSLALGLRQATPSLPDPAEATPEGAWASDSCSAIQGGLHTLFIGGVVALHDRVLAGLGEDVTTVVTGGDASLLLDALPGAIHRPGLVLDGLEILLSGDREDA